jgi:lipopolysaccharide/colanic/teichoic acid biosynthesis glycosyltransferase
MTGSVIDEEGKSRILHVTRVSDGLILERIIKNEGIKQIILLEIPLDPETLSLVVNVANKAGVCLHVVNNLSEIFRHDITFYSLHSRDFISLRNQPLEDPVNRILKRTVDVLVSLPIVIFILPPLCILVKTFQAIQSPGPLFHRETRAGLAFRPFRIFTFRTTRVHKDDDASTHGDRRVYPMGQLLRTTGLDKIPQFLNVFFGQMSLVGPHPNTPIQNRRFSEIMDQYHVRTFAKPGITGLAQVSGYGTEAKNDEDVAERAKLDIKYIETWSLPLDLSIIHKTFYQVFKPPKTAY